MSPKIIALLNQVESGKLTNDKARVLNQVKISRAATGPVLEARLNYIKPTTIYARLSDLEDLGLIKKQGQSYRIGQEQPYSIYRYVQDLEEQEQRRQAKRLQKFEAWKKRGLEEFSEFLHKGLRDELKQMQLF